MEVGIPWFYRFFSPGIRHVRRVLATLLSPDSPGSGGESLPTEAPGLWGRVVGRVAMGISLGYAVSMVNLWLIYGLSMVYLWLIYGLSMVYLSINSMVP